MSKRILPCKSGGAGTLIRTSGKLRRSLTCAAAVSALMCGSAFAQEADEEEDTLLGLDEVVVVGTAGGAGLSKQDAAFAVTSINEDAIDQFSPKSTADLLKVIPGLQVESSGGQNGANIFVRGFPGGGDAEFVTLQVNGGTIFHPSTLSFLENTQLFRVDNTVERVEAVIGGPGSVYSNGQPGLTANFIQRTGGDDFEGLVEVGTSTFGERRFDAYVSGPLTENTSFLIGGFYAASDGIRDAEFSAEEGGQITANLKHEFENGSVLVSARYLNDRGQWLLPIPVVATGDEQIDEFPGFDLGTGTFLSNDLRQATLPGGENFDAADGRGADIINLGAKFEYDLGAGITVNSNVSYLEGDAFTNGYVPGVGTVVTAAEFVDGLLAANPGASIGSLTGFNSGEVFDPNTTNVAQLNIFAVDKEIENFTNETVFSKSWTESINTSVGIYYADYSSIDTWDLGPGRLTTVENNATLLNLELAGTPLQFTDQTNGFISDSFFNQNSRYDGTDVAIFASADWALTDQLTVDGGLRWQNTSVDASLENNSFGVDVDGDPNTLFNNGSALLNGTFQVIDFDADDVSWTVGANFAVTSGLGVYARVSEGNRFPFFDNLRDGNVLTQSVRTYEGGVKFSSDRLAAFVNVFYNDVDGVQTTQILAGAPVASEGGTEAFGVEWQISAEPINNLTLDFTGNFLDADLVDFFNGAVAGDAGDLSGNQVARQPRIQFRFTPAYEFNLGFADVSLFGTVTYVGDRFSDNDNDQALPDYTKVDAGITAFFGDNRQFSLSAIADNLNDSNGLTEGNPRVLGTPGTDVIFARPILGRSVRFKLGYAF